jgi:23S rRNA (guanosine2251-2'-O)-methyltransferase
VRALLERHPSACSRLSLQQGRDDARAEDRASWRAPSAAAVERIDRQPCSARSGEVVHQGVAAEVSLLAPWPRRAAEAIAGVSAPLLLALDGVQDPHNLGACLRTADACGVLALIVPRDRAAPLNATARKVAAGAAETTPVVTVTNLARTLGCSRNRGCGSSGPMPRPELPAAASI